MANTQTLEIPISGMDCAECTQHVQHAIEKLPGVQSVNVFLGTEKAVVKLDPAQVDIPMIRSAVQGAGYDVPASNSPKVDPISMGDFNRKLTVMLVSVFAIILSVVIFGEVLGLFDFLNERVPFLFGLVLVIAGGYPVFMNVIRATLKRQIISHTLMTLGVIAALVVAPFIRDTGALFGLEIASESALAAGIVMGVMIIPLISSLSDDVISVVPQSLREGSLGLGATQTETILKVILPSALPGVVGALLLATSRAIGETMIVVMAAGMAANLTINPLEAVTTVTVQIVALLTGDQEFASSKTLSAFALGLALFFTTLALNAIALIIVKKYREQYD